MSDIAVLVIAISQLVTALVAAVIGLVALIRAGRTERKVDENTALTTEVKGDVTLVKGSVDGAATAAAAEKESLERELKFIRAELADKKVIAALLAQSTATAAKASNVHVPEKEEP